MKNGQKNHIRLIERYSDLGNLSNFLKTDIQEIYIEETFRDVFGINSKKTPDIIALNNENIYIGEIKGNYSLKNIFKAEHQVGEYYRILQKHTDIKIIPFIVVGSYENIYF